MEQEALKFAWAYLLTHGKLTSGKWSIYGGNYEEPHGAYVHIDTIREKALEIGIDWTRTTAPEVTEESEFMDTFSPSRDCLGTLGRLYLMNGKSFLIGSGDNDAAHLAETAKKMLEKAEVTKLAAKL